MAQAVSCQPVTEEAWFNPRSVITAFMVEKWHWNRFLFKHIFFLY
jgi:hypothetical protein